MADRGFSRRSLALGGEAVIGAIERSWERCNHHYGIDPKAPHQPAVLESGRVREERDHHGEILQIARAEMHQLYSQIAGSGYSLLLTDAKGVILDYVGDETLKRSFRDAGLWVGAVWDEAHEGTNGIGTCIAEGEPVSVFRDQHFRARHQGLSCSGAPVWGPQGELMAVLDASCVNDRESMQTQSHTLALVNTSAQFLTKWRFLREYSEHVIVRFHRHCEYVGLISDGVVAVDERGVVCGADRNALHFLGVGTREKLLGRPVSEVFDTTVEWLESCAEDRRLSYWSLNHATRGTPFFAKIDFSEGSRWARTQQQSRVVLRRFPKPLEALDSTLQALAGGDERLEHSAQRARRVHQRRIPVILHGETGTGKERLAQALHEAGPRRHGPFVALDCASIPETLIESELFGYRGGAFTGAERKGRKGKIQHAHGGTLFLDEIGDMPVGLQTRLLRVLEEHEVVPLGGGEPETVDIAVISATHRNLEALVREGTFREDLYYRLNGLTVTLPPLRERTDLPQLIERLLQSEADEAGDPVPELSDAARERLCAHAWPGNVRQLRNVLRTAVALAADGVIGCDELPDEFQQDTAPAPAAGGRASSSSEGHVFIGQKAASASSAGDGDPLRSAERATIVQTLDRHGGNVTRTAAELGVSRNTLYRKMHKHKLI